MGARCCRCKEGTVLSDDHSDRVGDPQGQTAATPTRVNTEPSSQQTSTPIVTPSKAKETFVSVVLEIGESSNTNSSIRDIDEDGYRASNTLWTTGSFSDPIPDGFYSVIQNDRLNLFENIPTLDKLRVMDDEGLKGDVIHIDFKNDKMLYRLKELITALVQGLDLTQAEIIKEVSDLIATQYERQKLKSPADSHTSSGIQLLGDNKLVSSRARAILFKVLADHVGLQSRLLLGYPSDHPETSVDSHDQMYVVVVDNTEEMMVDLMQSPVELIHLERIDYESSENDENLPEHSLVEPSGPPSDLPGSESNLATEFQIEKPIEEEGTSTSSQLE